MAAVCVLLVACATITNLLLARGLMKDRPYPRRRSAPLSGASRERLVRKALAVFGAVAPLPSFVVSSTIITARSETAKFLKLNLRKLISKFSKFKNWLQAARAVTSKRFPRNTWVSRAYCPLGGPSHFGMRVAAAL